MNQSQYLQDLINATEANSTVTISGTLSENLTQVGGNSIAVNSGNLSSGVPRFCIATNDVNISSMNTNLSTISGAVSSNLMNINTTELNGIGIAVNSGNLDNGTQRMCIASNDTLTNSINSNIFIMSQAVDGVTTNKFKCKIMDTSGNAVNVTSNSLNVNQAFLNSVAPSVGSGVNGTGVQRVSVATDDQLCYFQLEPRFQAFNYTSTSWRTHIIGGIAPNITSTDWVVFPNDSTPTYNKTNVVPGTNNTHELTFSDGNDLSVIGIGNVYINWVNGNGTTLTVTNQTISATPTTLTGLGIHEFIDMWIGVPTILPGPNHGDITMDDSGTKFLAWIPPYAGTCAKWYVQMPSNAVSKIFLHELNCTCSHATNGFRVFVQMNTFDFGGDLINEYVLYKDYILPNSSKKIDLSYITANTWVSGLNPNSNRVMVCIYAQGGTDAVPLASSGSAFLTCSTYRV